MSTDVYFDNLPETYVDQYRDMLAALVQEAVPYIKTQPGTALDTLLFRPAGASYAYMAGCFAQLSDAWNLKYLSENPEAATDEVLDAIFSNYNQTRSEGTPATGLVEIVISELVTTVIPVGTQFTSGDVVYTTTSVWTGVTLADEVVGPTDRLMVDREDGTYSFQIEVVAVDNGENGNIPINTSLTADPSPARLVSIRAAGDFTGGTDADTNEDVLAKITNGLAAKILHNRDQATAAMQTVLPGLQAVSVIGMKDAEMHRDQRSLLGVSSGGKVDMYVRTQQTLESFTVTTTGTLYDANKHTWKISLNREIVAGAYIVLQVTTAGNDQAVKTILSQDWQTSLPTSGEYPDIRNTTESAFTMYQSVDVYIEDYSDAENYDLRIIRMPGITTAQGYCSDRQYVDPMADWLVKAAIPVITSVTLSVTKPSGVTIDTAAIKSAVAAAINSQSFTTKLAVSRIIDAAQSLLPAGCYVNMPLEVIGIVIRPDRQMMYLRSPNELVVPDVLSQSVSGRTAAFFTMDQYIQIN